MPRSIKFNLTIIVLLSILIIASGCKKFEEINIDPARPEETSPQFLLANAQKRAVDLMYNGYYNGRIGMHFAQYWTGTDKTSESRNLITDDGLWAGLYSGPLMDLQEIGNYYNRHPQERNPHMLAVAEILKSWIFHVLTDVYVDIPFSQALQVDKYPQPSFDKAEDIYEELLKVLKEQITILTKEAPSPIVGDIIGNGSAEKWVRFANALRMRIALRMADVRPNEAKSIIEEACVNTIISVEDDIFFPYENSAVGSRFPYNEVDRDLVEFAVTTTLIDYQKAGNDPRLPMYARPAENSGTFVGKPYGTAANEPLLSSLSKPSSIAFSPKFKGYILTYAEVMFIKAEAAARGINIPDGTAEQLYEAAIRASMQQWGITDEALIEEYLAAHPFAINNWKNIIGTEKWIALYMQGIQSWLERLRLDFKRPDGTALFISPVSGSLDPDVSDVPHRLNYPNATRNTNAANVAAAAQRIGGDTKATKNWWDIY